LKEKKNITTNKETTQEQKVASKKTGSLINYQWITGNITFFLFMALLAVAYIANGHMADKTIRDISTTAKQIKELQYEYKTLKSELMFKSREAEMVKAAAPLGLQIATEPPMHLQVDHKKAN